MSEIYELKEAHILQCAELYVAIFNAEPWCDAWTIETAQKRLQDIYHTPNFKGIVYTKDEAIVGAIFGTIEQWYEGYQYNLKEMFVHNSSQTSGIGSHMVTELERQLKEVGVNSAVLFTSKGDQVDRFYLKNGYHELDFMCMMFKNF